MRKALLSIIAGIGVVGIVLLLAASGGGQVLASEMTPEPYPYVIYIPLVMKSSSLRMYPVDWCSYVLYQKLASGDGLLGACASARPTEAAPVPEIGTGRAPSPSGGYGTMAARTFLKFPEESAGISMPTLVISGAFVNGTNATRCWIDVHVFSLPAALWTEPFTITPEAWALIGPRLGATTVDIPQSGITVTVPLSGFSPTMAILSRCETHHELCAADPFKYSWLLIGLETFLEWSGN